MPVERALHRALRMRVLDLRPHGLIQVQIQTRKHYRALFGIGDNVHQVGHGRRRPGRTRQNKRRAWGMLRPLINQFTDQGHLPL